MERLPLYLVALMVVGGMHGGRTAPTPSDLRSATPPVPGGERQTAMEAYPASPCGRATPPVTGGERRTAMEAYPASPCGRATPPVTGGERRTARAAVPGDKLQEHAVGVINGAWGRQPAWKVRAAWYALGRSVTVQGRAKVTTYCDKCDRSGCGSDGGRLADGVVAANPEVNGHQVIWTEAYGFGIVCDRGGAVKLGRYVRGGEGANFDTYMRDGCVGDCWTGPGTKRMQMYAVIGDVETVIGETAEGEWRRPHPPSPSP